MHSYRDVALALSELQLPPDSPVIVHGSLSALGEVRGGAEAVVSAICATSRRVMFPAFTYKSMVIPGDGPENNGIIYGSGSDLNLMAESYSIDMPVDSTLGILAETFRKSPHANRSFHPILSFSAINLDDALLRQSVTDPFAPIEYLYGSGGWVILLGVDQTVNTSIHFAERLAGRKQFIRWGLIKNGIVECPGFPGCSNGFNSIMPMVENITHTVKFDNTTFQAIPVDGLIQVALAILEADPHSLLCDCDTCERCNSVRNCLPEVAS